MPHKPITSDDITIVAPNIIKLIIDIIASVGKNSDGGVRITAAEWHKIGEDAGFVVKDLVPLITHK